MGEQIYTVGDLVGRIEVTKPKAATRLVAIDGRGGAGKSTIARQLRDRLSDARVIGVDDFWLPKSVRPERERVIAEPGCDYDWQRLRDQVIVLLSEDRPAAVSAIRLGDGCAAGVARCRGRGHGDRGRGVFDKEGIGVTL